MFIIHSIVLRSKNAGVSGPTKADFLVSTTSETFPELDLARLGDAMSTTLCGPAVSSETRHCGATLELSAHLLLLVVQRTPILRVSRTIHPCKVGEHSWHWIILLGLSAGRSASIMKVIIIITLMFA